jgi:hypothetical protein
MQLEDIMLNEVSHTQKDKRGGDSKMAARGRKQKACFLK